MIDWLWELLREVWRTKQVPQEWKNAILIPLHKKQSRKACDNYRGIALLSVPGKVQSLTLLNRLQANPLSHSVDSKRAEELLIRSG